MGNVIAFPAIQTEYDVGLQMAVGAEYFQVPDYFKDQHLADVITLHSVEFSDDRFCVNADAIPGLDSIRLQARVEAEEIFERNRQLLRDGDFEAVPLDVNALGTAAKVAEMGEKYGKQSEEFLDARSGLQLDHDRKYAEAIRKNKWVHFGVTTQNYEPAQDELFANGLSVDVMITNGLSPVAEPEEAELRKNDYVYHSTSKAILMRPDADELAAIRIRPCPDYAIKSHKLNPHGAHGGYAPEIEKMMLDYDTFDTKSKRINHEQAGVSGIYITSDVINETLQIIGAVESGKNLGKTDIHATVGIVSNDVITGVTDVLKILDKVASEKTGLNIFLGEEVEADNPKDYELMYIEAESRKKQQETLSEELSCYVEDLHARDIEPALATVMVEKHIQQTLLMVAADDPEQAEIIFNRETAEGFREVQSLHSQGRHQEAIERQAQVETSAPAPSSCGAGSCGLEAISNISKEEEKELQEKLKAEPGDKIVKDTVRNCKNCGEKKLVYAYNKTKVHTLCEGCGILKKK